jgi:glycosyltransferase involved in cell wall biosynthesis
MDQPTTVTALVPAYQAADFVQDTLDALSRQTRIDLRVLISVDACTDDTHAICVKHAAADPRFRVVRQNRRLGYVGNCNYLLGQADTDYALFAFHDDLLAPDYVERLCAALDQHPRAVIAYSDVQLTHVDGKQEHWAYTTLDGMTDRVERGLKMLGCVGPWWVPNRGVFRLARVLGIGGLKTHGGGEFSADWPWLLHMALLGEFVRVPATLCFKYYKPGSLSRSWKFTMRLQYEVTAACVREIWNADLSTDEKLRLAIPAINWMAKTRPGLPAEPGLAASPTGRPGEAQHV